VQEQPALLNQLVHTATGVVTRPLAAARLLPTAARSVSRLVRTRSDDSTGSGGAVPFAAPRAPFNGRISAGRVVAFADVAVEDVKAVKSGLGGTFNDVVIAVCGSAFRRYLQGRGDLPSTSLIAVCPVSVRSDHSEGNAVSAMFTTLATDVEDPAERFETVRRANDVGKADHEAIGGDLLQQAAELAPPNMTTAVARLYSTMRLADLHPVVHNVVISNVPGPPVQLYFAGAAIEGLYPLGPVLEGPALNITVLSYRDRVGFGFIGCAERIPDLDDLAAAVPGALAELVAAAQAPG
jgi:diacylglycerol O-acyltransferase